MHVTPKIDTAIIIHSQVGIELGLVIFLRQRVEIRLLYGKEKLFTSLWTLLHTLLVVFLHLLGNGSIQILNRIEDVITEWSKDPAVDNPHMVFNETLVLRMHRTCRDGYTAVVVTEVIKNLVEHGHPIITLDDCCFEVVRHKDLRYSAYVP